jgi:hypothetical protein
MTAHQTVFSDLLAQAMANPHPEHLARRRRPRIPPATAPLADPDHLARLLSILLSEGVSYATYVHMLAISAVAPATPSIAYISLQLGYSCHASRKQITRNPWFATIPDSPVRCRLTTEGQEKLSRIIRRILKPHC